MTDTPSELPAGDASPGIQHSPPGKEHGKPGKGRLETTPPPSGQTGAGLTAPEATKPPGKQKGQPERGLASPSPEQPPGGTANAPERGRHMGRPQGQGAPPPTTLGQPGGPPSSGAAPGEARGGKQKGQGAYASLAEDLLVANNMAKGNQRAERKRAKRLLRVLVLNNSNLV